MPTHLRVLLILHLGLFVLAIFSAMVSTSSEAVTNFAISAWFAIVAFGIWAQLNIIRYALWFNGLVAIATAIFQSFVVFFLFKDSEQQQVSLILPVVSLLIQLFFGVYTVFAVRSSDAKQYFQRL